jgi:rubredoxin
VAYHDHCEICDYSEELGAPPLNIPPGGNGKVRWNSLYGDCLCRACADTITETLISYGDEDEDNPTAYPLPEVSE